MFKRLFVMEAEGTGGGAGGTGANAGGGGASGGEGGGNQTPWYSTLPEETRNYVEAKGFKDPASLAESYRNLEKLRGVPENRLVQIPEKDDDAEGWGKVYNRLGRPEKSEEYKIEVPAGTKEDFKNWAQGEFHKLGLTKKQGEALAKSWNERMGNDVKAQKEAETNAQVEQAANLKKEWGQAFDQNVALVDKMADAVGIDAKTEDKLINSLGIDGYSKLMQGIVEKFGINLGEDNYQGGERGNFQGILSPGAAQEKISMLMQDADFSKRYSNGDVSAREEMDKLHRWAYPEELAG